MKNRVLLDEHDLQRPWLGPYRKNAANVRSALARGAGVAEALALCSRERRFVDPSQSPRSEHYEAFIARTGTVPIRDDLHDLFNGLVWLAFPLAKRRLNTLHAEQIESTGVGATRGALRDAITVFDENGALLQAPAALLQALARRDWPGLFLERRALWRETRLVLFGHALLEKLLNPRKAICAHVLPLAADSGPTTQHADALDAALAALLSRETLSGKPFLPLPVLGVPGWWAGNDDPAFYDDAAVFRSATGAASRAA